MRFLLISALSAVVLAAATSREAAAQWCAFYDEYTYTCGFKSVRQCLDTISGIGGECRPDPFPPTARERQRSRQPRSSDGTRR